MISEAALHHSVSGRPMSAGSAAGGRTAWVAAAFLHGRHLRSLLLQLTGIVAIALFLAPFAIVFTTLLRCGAEPLIVLAAYLFG